MKIERVLAKPGTYLPLRLPEHMAVSREPGFCSFEKDLNCGPLDSMKFRFLEMNILLAFLVIDLNLRALSDYS